MTSWQTCKTLYDMLEDRSIWRAVVHDITQVIPLPRLSVRSLLSMSSSELRHKATRSTRINDLWDQNTITPSKIEYYAVADDILGVEVIPGGDWLLKLCRDGTLHLHPRDDLVNPVATIARPSRDEWVYAHSAYMRRSYFPNNGGDWVAVVDHYTSVE